LSISTWSGSTTICDGAAGEHAVPVVRRLRARISGETLAKLLAPVGVEGRLIEGGAQLTVKLPLSNATAELVGSAPGNGRLRLEAIALRVGGFLPVPIGLVEFAIQRIAAQPGIYRAGPHSIDLDLSELLAALPLRFAAAIRSARFTREFLEIECAEP